MLVGINPFDFNWTLEKDEEFISPEVVHVRSSEGYGEMSRVYHKLYRTRLVRGKYRDIVRPVLINNWETTRFNISEEIIMDFAQKAKECGIDMVVMDDGWFAERNNDRSSLGDWFVNSEKIPSGISGLCKRIENFGLKFGLWFEPEMVSKNSKLFDSHPEWIISVNGRYASESRHQYMLDLSRPEVCDYIYDSIAKILNETNITYIK